MVNTTDAQVLDLATVTVRATVTSAEAGTVQVAVWSDINSVGQADAVHVEVNASSPVTVTARIDLWRTQFVNQTEGDIDDSARGQ